MKYIFLINHNFFLNMFWEIETVVKIFVRVFLLIVTTYSQQFTFIKFSQQFQLFMLEIIWRLVIIRL